MPLVRIDILKGRTPAAKKALLESAHAALVEPLQIPEDDRTLRLHEYSHEDFEIPPGMGETYTLIEVTLFPGRSLRAERHLYQALVRNLGTLGIPASDILIVLHEPALENWGLRGGQPASEVDLGFKIDV